MSGGNLAYHLRPNKAVDRHLFIELLQRVNPYRRIGRYTYVSFGGPFLEDFRLMHSHFGMRQMISLEISPEVLERQRFNKPLTCIGCRLMNSGDFVASYNIEGNAIVWLDYADPKEIRVQLQEFQALLPKLTTGDIVKITLNANPESLVKAGDRSLEQVAGERLAELQKRVGDFLPNDTTEAMMTSDELPQVLFRAVQRVSHIATKGIEQIFVPLTAFHYTDSHTMLTVAGIVLTREEKTNFFKSTALDKWDLSLIRTKASTEIMVPALSTKERLFLDSLLPRHREKRLRKRLKFLFEEGEEKTLRTLKSYARFYRHYPYYSRIIP